MSNPSLVENALEHPEAHQQVSEEVSKDEAARKKMDFKLQIMLRRGLLKAFAVAVEMGQEGHNGNTASGLLASMVKDNLLLHPLKPSGSTGDLSKETGLFKFEFSKETLLRVAQETGAQALQLAQRELEERSAFTVLAVVDPTRPVSCDEMVDLHTVCANAKAQLLLQHDQLLVQRSRDGVWETVMRSWGDGGDPVAHVESYYGEQIAYLLRSQAHLSSFLLAATACLVTCWCFYGLPSPPSTPSDWWKLLPWSLCWHGCLYFYWSKITQPWSSAIRLDAKPRGLVGPTPAEMEYFRLDERVRAAIVSQSSLADREAAPLVSVTYSIPGPIELAQAVGQTMLAGVVGQWIWSYVLEFSVVPTLPLVGQPLQSMLASHCSVVCMALVQARRVREAREKDGKAETADIKVTKNARGKTTAIHVRVPNRHTCLKVYLALACSACLFLDYPLECLRGYIGGLWWWGGPSPFWLAWAYGMHMAMYIALYGLLEIGLDVGAGWVCRLDPSLGWLQGLGANGARVFSGHLVGYKGRWEEGVDGVDKVIMASICRETGKNSHARNYEGCDDTHLRLCLLASHVLFYGPLCPPLLVLATILAVATQITEWYKLCDLVRRPIPAAVGGNEKAWAHFLLVAVAASLPVNTLTAYLVGGWRAFIAMAGPAAYTAYLIHSAWEMKSHTSSETQSSPKHQARPRTMYETYRKEKRRESRDMGELPHVQSPSAGIMQGS